MILIVDGINTAAKGAGLQVLNTWKASLQRAGIEFDIQSVVPDESKHFGRILNYIWLAIYFFPGTALRVFKFPFFEFFLKCSPSVIARFLVGVYEKRPEAIYFSHHVVFLLGLFVSREKRNFIVHDCLYRRARSMGYGRNTCKLLFLFEIWLYSQSTNIYCLSIGEKRIFDKFLKTKVKLIRGFDTDFVECQHGILNNGIAIVSDWRRRENWEGVYKFFKIGFDASLGCGSVRHLKIKVYGYMSAELVKSLANDAEISSMPIDFAVGGVYSSLSDIKEDVFLVPIYLGAGIKIKVLEAIFSRKYVLGTNGAFIGLPRSWLNGVARKVCRPQCLYENSSDVGFEYGNFCEFVRRYREAYADFGQLLAGTVT